MMNKVITIVGLGNMGSSLAKGLAKSPLVKNYQLELYDLHHERSSSLAKNLACRSLSSLQEMSPGPEQVLVLAVKPHDLGSLAQELKTSLHVDSLVLSMLAGVSLEVLNDTLAFSGATARAMPNIAAIVGEAATVMCANSVCGDKHRKIAEQVFSAVGEAYWAKEELMDTVTGLSGSGPAYIYMVIEAMTDGGVKMGLPRQLAQSLASQTVLGAASLVKESGQHPAVLKDQVTTPAGTTISALHELEERGLRSMFVSAVEIATNRSKDLCSMAQKRDQG